ncbi:MAG: ZIP family metal transporter [Natronomonas sp.]|jgi:ZIP family zinc transporter|uniref:ZIP family metal transporter n=1 Tax=Natronomonas salsuginis TaxID=2217661 RepID=A0A4V5ZNP4_9EURY|nr:MULTISPECIES: ZIP family metal transporter [Natronomonas]MDR9380747.1 ZIP family metal transporter [Natronomonas sp.]MDR9429767.1 ZIP family metal transporter [Natronomonas sp.]TKR24683.1 ZIP family metal transporter [Natronomonas salsuginis]
MQVEIAESFVTLLGTSPVRQALVGGFIIALLNLVGAMLVLVWRNPSQRALNGMLGFAAGVMLAAAFTSLIIPGIEEYSGGNPIPTLIGVALGALFLDRADALIPHAHYLLTGRRRTDAADPAETLPVTDERLAGVTLFILAITLHNMPEGLAVGVGFGAAGGDPARIGGALSLMLAIGLQNIPEGLAVSVAAINAGLDRRLYAVFAGVRAGVVEIPLAVLGAVAVTTVEPLLPYAMGFAAGAMLFVISDEIIPETHKSGYERVATLGLMIGVIVMLYLDIALAG